MAETAAARDGASMTVRNTSRYPTSVVRALVALAASFVGVSDWPLDVRVTAAGVALKGEFDNGVIAIAVGAERLFPFETEYGGVRLLHACWREAVFATAVHEFVHAIQAARGGESQLLFDEGEAEEAARRALVLFRGERA